MQNIKKMREGMTDSHLLLSFETEMNRTQQGTCRKKAGTESGFTAAECRQKRFSPEGGRIALFANERIAECIDFAIQDKFAYVNKLKRLHR